MSAILLSLLLMGAPSPGAVAPSGVKIYENAAAGLDAKPTKPNGTDLICWDEKPAGSHIVKRICATRAEVERMQQAARDALSERARPGAGGMTSH